MALKVNRREFLGIDEFDIPSYEVMSAKMVLDFEVSIFRVMETQGITQKELAERLGVTAATISKTLSKTSNMTFKTAARIAHALGCVIDAPTIRTFDADEYGAGVATSSTTAIDVSTVSKKDDYANTSRSKKVERSIPQRETVRVVEYNDWRTAA